MITQPLSTATPLLELSGVSRMYGTVIGVNDLTVNLPPGAYGLVGPNGAGKSTLIALITGALRPTLGSLRVFGKNPTTDPSVLQRIGLCPTSDLFIPRVSARMWLEQLLAISGWSPRLAKQRTNEVLDLVQLQEAADKPIASYSLGMRQRCKIAQALAHNPDFLILDEPFNGLDPIGRHQMTELLKQWSKSGKSLLLASHVLHEVEAVTDAFMLIYGGRLLAVGTAGELRGLIADLPQEVSVQCSDPQNLASLLAKQPWVSSLRVKMESKSVEVSVKEPLQLYTNLSLWAGSGQIDVHGLSGSDCDLSTLFRLLVSRHQGQAQ